MTARNEAGHDPAAADRHEVPQDPDQLKTVLLAAGISPDNANKIVAEVSYEPIVAIRDFREMTVGRKTKDGFVEATPAEQVLANKLMALLVSDLFTDEERALMLYVKPNSRVKKGFH